MKSPSRYPENHRKSGVKDIRRTRACCMRQAGDSGSRAQRANGDLSTTNLPEARRKVFSSGFVCNSRLRTLSTIVKGTGDFIDEPPSVVQGGKGVVVPGAALLHLPWLSVNICLWTQSSNRANLFA